LLPVASRAADAFQFTQVSKLAGPYDLFVSKEALKAINRDTGFVLYSQAPDWQILLCNPPRKVYATMPSDKFTGNMAHTISMIDAVTIEHLQFVPGSKKETLMGLQVIHSTASIKESEFRTGLDPTTARVWSGDCWELDQHLVPVRVCHALQRLYGLPLRNNLPLRVLYHDLDKTMTAALETFKCKQGKVDVSYSVPPNFKKVSTEMEVCAVGAGKGSALDLLMR